MSTGCKKDIVELNDVPVQVISKKSESIGNSFPKVSPDGRSNVSYYQGVNLKEKNFEVYLLAQEKLRNISNDGRSTMLQIDSIDFESCNVIQDTTETIYSCLIRTSIDSAFYNLIIEDSSGVVYGPYVLEYVMDSTFMSNLIAGTVDMSSFEGSMAKYTLDALFTPFAGGPDSRDCTHEECWELIFGGYGSGSGSSSGGLSPGTGVFVPSTNQTGSGGIPEIWCFKTIMQINGQGQPYIVTIVHPCDYDPDLYPLTGNGNGSSFCDEEECLRFFPDLGFPVNDPFEDAGQVTPPIDPFLECQENALDFSKDHCGLRTRSKANGVDLSSFCMDGGGYDTQSALMAVMGLTTEQQTWLASNPTLFNDVVAFLDDKCWDEMATTYAGIVIEEVSSPEVSGYIDSEALGWYFMGYDELFNYLESVTQNVQEIENGIEITETNLMLTPQSLPPGAAPFGGSNENPLGGPDLGHDTNGDPNIFIEANRPLAYHPESLQESRMRSLLYMLTIFYGMKPIAKRYMDEFKENTEVFNYYDAQLSSLVMDSRKMTNWLKRYGEELNNMLKGSNGVIFGLQPIIDRPALNENYGFTILINDTQKVNVYIDYDTYNFNPFSGEWEAKFIVNVIDHFGLDYEDAIDYQNYHSGFVSWWALQYRRDWVPFKTDIWFEATLKGNINN